MSGSSTFAQTVLVLTHLASQPGPRTAAELAAGLGLEITLVRRLLRILCEQQLVMLQKETLRYSVGPAAFRLAGLIRNSWSIEHLARPYLSELVRELGETVVLNVYLPEKGTGVCAAVEESSKPLQYKLQVGEQKFLHVGASGKTILAFLDEASRDAALARNGLPSITDKTTIDRAQLARQLARIRKLGYCVSKGERIPGAVGIGVPVSGERANVVGSLVVTIPVREYDAPRVAGIVSSLQRYAGQMSLAFGNTDKGR